MYLVNDEFYAGGENHGVAWKAKKNGIIWRGEASGGRAGEDVWHHFHRYRLVQMLNGTTVSQTEKSNERSLAFDMLSRRLYRSQALSRGRIGAWLDGSANAGFVKLCPPGTHQHGYKYLPDVDGNSFSARYHGFLPSSSLPLKATIYAERHDDGLTPWMHFAPFDNTFHDLYSILDYFADGPGRPGDTAAQFVAKKLVRRGRSRF
ncbi:hypothetical protein Trco_005914 [Trichoderma cornu-damae]|uniref:Glycosyl transferase CAP10 domain-containing protein n=1 Tax=Trichoderma cornu-damae TaxID=654480 RepID=A0A9P8QI29_9HYPO|nr:hypothetical protein Trco_005914 [Trichoderma cornu-damae]